MVLPFVILGIVAAIGLVGAGGGYALKVSHDRYLASPAGQLAEAERKKVEANRKLEEEKKKYRNVILDLERLRLTWRDGSKR